MWLLIFKVIIPADNVGPRPKVQYQLVTKNMNWDDAALYCEKFHHTGSLVAIRNPWQQKAVESFLESRKG